VCFALGPIGARRSIFSKNGSRVNRASAEQSCWPTWRQELLLRAVLLQGKNSLDAWENWKSSGDINDLDRGSERLLPQLYRNLHDYGVRDPVLSQLKVIYRRTWRDNQLLFHQVSALLGAFHANGIETIVLKGAALALLHYKDVGLRPMNDFDVMIHEEKRSAAMQVMSELGWTPIPRWPEGLTEGYLSVVNSHGFAHSAGRECDLHWHLFPECCQPDADNDFWEQAVPFRIHGVLTRALAPADQLLHVCVHGAEWNPIPPIRWITDAMMIMKSSSIDWNRILDQARKRQLMLPLRATLNYLVDEFEAPVPADTLESLRRAAISKLERAEYKYKIQNFEPKALGYLPLLWFRYLRLEGNKRSGSKLIGFVKYLQRFWGAEKIWHLPTFGALMAVRRTRLIAARFVNRASSIALMKRYSGIG
jgi:hypothetical protein